MKKMSHPNFILGIVSLLLLFIGVGLRRYGYRAGDVVFFISIGLGAIHWIWSIIDVFKDYRLNNNGKENKNIIWVILIIIVPPVGGLLYYPWGRKIRM